MSIGARLRLSLLIVAGLLAGCAARAELQLGSSSSRPLETLPALAARWPLAGGPHSAAGAVAARAGGLVAARLEPGGARELWQRDAEVSEPPLLAGTLVVLGEGARLQALEAATGRPIWSLPRDAAHLAAVADDGELTALVLEDARRERRELRVLDRSGGERFRVQATPELGSPALRAGMLLLPWGGRFVSALDVASGSELARAGVEPTLRHVLWVRDEPFLAGPPWVGLGNAESRHALPARPLPGRVEPGGESFAASPGPDVTRLFALPPSDPAAELPAVLATYGRLAMSFESRRGSLHWVRLFPGVILGAALGADSVTLCDASGLLRVLDRDGARTLSQLHLARARRSEAALQSCALTLGRNAAPPEPSAAESPPRESLVDQLARVLSLADPDLASAQRFLSRELAARPEPEATRVLIALASRQSADPQLQAEAEDLLATRRNGAEFMLQALEHSGAPVDPVARAPVGALADALAALEERRGAPLLAAQLNRVGHSAAALARVARALEQLASEAEYPALQVFFSLRRTSADPPELVDAVLAVGRTLLRVGAAPGRRLVQWAARDALTAPQVRAQLESALATLAQ